MTDGTVVSAPVCPDDGGIWPGLTEEERILLNVARGIQDGDPESPVGILPIAQVLGWGKKRVKNRVDSLRGRDLWPIPACRRGGWRGPADQAPLTNFELAARIQMARRQKVMDHEMTRWRRQEANRLRAIHCRAIVSRQRRMARGITP